MTDSKRVANSPASLIVVACITVAAGIFVLDLLMPLGVAAGVPYVGLVLISLYSPWRRLVFLLAIVSTVLIMLGYFFSSPLVAPWIVITNRLFALVVVWMTAEFCQRRQQVERSMVKSERKLSFHLQNTPIAAIEWNLDFEVTEWNVAAEKVFGHSKKEALGRHAAGLLVSESARKHVDRVWNTLLENKGGRHSTNKNFTKDGRTIICDWNNTPLLDDNGKVFGVVSLVQDITQRKLAEEEIKRVSAQLQTSIKHMPIAYILWDSDQKVLKWNGAAEKIFGYSSEELLGERFLELIVPDTVKHLVDNVVEGLFSGKPSSYSEKDNNIRKDGQLISCLWHNTPIKDADGTVTAILSMTQDVTEQLRAEEALRESEEKYRTLFENATEAIFIYDPNSTRIIDANAATSRMYGYDMEELIGMSCFSLSAEKEKSASTMKTIQAEGNASVSNRLHIKKDGTVFSVDLSAYSITYGGKNAGIAISKDITETRRLQNLEARAQRLETAGQIAGQVAHDFNNLLGPLMAYPEFIREELPGNHPALAYLDDIEHSALKIADINQQLLTLGRRGHYNQETLNLNSVIHHAVKELGPTPDTLILETKLAENLLNIMGGASQIHRAVSNLLHNALDAVQEVGQITITTENYYVDDVSIAYGRVPRGEYVKLTISDSGCGIPDEIVQKIFDPFFTTKTTDQNRGSGLGLSVVNSVVQDHGAFIDLSTCVGKGTSFFIYFPPNRQSAEEQQINSSLGGDETVLIVDDDEIQRDVSNKLLEKLGYSVSSVKSGEKAVELIRQSSYDILILDMVMPPGIDGVETYRRILEIRPDQKALIVSGFSESARVFEAQSLGAGAFVKKPLTRTTIATALRTGLDRKPKSTAH